MSQSKESDNSPPEDHTVNKYLLDGESVATSVEVRPTGIIGWLKSLFGIGIVHWFVTNHRLIQTRTSWGEFTFNDISHKKIASIGYDKRIPRSTLVFVLLTIVGTLLLFLILPFAAGEAALLVLLIPVFAVLYALLRRRQVLVVTATGGQELSLVISKGADIDQLILYLHTARTKREKE